jgi:hypothetical protein
MILDVVGGVCDGAAAVLLCAAVAKATDMAGSRSAMLGLFPRLRSQPSSRLHAALSAAATTEAIIATLLVVAPTSRIVAAAFGVVALGFLLVNVRAFRRNVACGCFGSRNRAQSRRATVFRAGLMSGAAIAAVTRAQEPIERFSPTTLIGACGFCALIALNERESGSSPGRGKVFRQTRCRRKDREPILQRLTGELRRTLSPSAVAHADLAWWAADVNCVSDSGGVLRTFVVAVPGSRGRLTAIVEERGISRLILMTPGGPVAGLTAQLNHPTAAR